MLAFFVTGTDTGVGKTQVATSVLAAAAERGWRTAAMKPAETGCGLGMGGELVPADAGRLAAAMTLSIPLDEVCPYRYREPAAPAVAARGVGEEVDVERLRACFAEIVDRSPELLLVEGAGGLLVSLNERTTMADLAATLGLPLIVVARDGLGTLNHTMLTVEAARARGLRVAAIVLNGAEPGTDPERARSNRLELEAAGLPIAAWVPHGQDAGASILDFLSSSENVPRGTFHR